jgi:tRNA(His) guanylyltransferase
MSETCTPHALHERQSWQSSCTAPGACRSVLVQGTDAGFKNELLFSQFEINYAQLPEQFKKGSLVIRETVPVVVKHKEDGTPIERMKPQERVLYCDIIGQAFWDEYLRVLEPV